MTDEKLQLMQKQLMNEMKKEEDIERQITEGSKEVGAKLTLQPKAKLDIQDKSLVFAYKDLNHGKRKGILMTIADARKMEILQGKYVPYTVTAEIVNDFTLTENLTSIVEAGLRHIFDRVKVGEV